MKYTIVTEDGMNRMPVEVLGANENGMLVKVTCPPAWFLMRLQKRGIFISLEAEWQISLALRRDRSYFDLQTMDVYKVEQTPGT